MYNIVLCCIVIEATAVEELEIGTFGFYVILYLHLVIMTSQFVLIFTYFEVCDASLMFEL